MKFDLDWLYLAAFDVESCDIDFWPERWAACTFVNKDLDYKEFSTLEEAIQAVENSLVDGKVKGDAHCREGWKAFIRADGKEYYEEIRRALPRFNRKTALKKLSKIIRQKCLGRIKECFDEAKDINTFLGRSRMADA